MTHNILVADDMEMTRQHLRQILESEGYQVETAGDGQTAWDRLRSGVFHLVVTDLLMPGMSGQELLSAIRGESMPVGVILITALNGYEAALQAMKEGADDYLTKPVDPERLPIVVRRTLERRRMMDELAQLRREAGGAYHLRRMVSKNPRIRRVFELIERVGPTNSTVLIQGETGTGKELVARALHASGPRSARAFVALNCAVLNESLLESELFGHERGAFTGADRRKLGRFEQAHQGTLLLDEIGDISPLLQAKLLRVLQTGTFERLGGTETIKVDVRIVAATNKRLEQEVKQGRFRQDLFYRLNVVSIDLPPLRERPEDIPLLARDFLERYRGPGGQPSEISTQAMRALLRHSWPGNVRELENAIKAGLALAEGPVLKYEDLPESVAPRALASRAPAALDLDRSLPELTGDLIAQVEREYFTRLLELYKGNVARCARHSGLSRRSVTQKLLRYQLDRRTFKVPLTRRPSV